ncbi:MAG: MliC family protein [Variovorax sp.]|nr:MliC family protein [Variovorax sp.]
MPHASLRAMMLSLALSLVAAPPVSAAPPSFSCAKASGAAEQAICQDGTLAALDREIARLYRLALGGRSLDAQRRKELIATQRGWIKGRNDCWKAGDLAACIRDSAMSRIGELRAQFPAARSDDAHGVSLGPVAVRCPQGAKEIQATFVNVEPPMALLAWADRQSLVLTIARSASGARYTAVAPGGDALFWQKGPEARVQLPGGAEQVCSVG